MKKLIAVLCLNLCIASAKAATDKPTQVIPTDIYNSINLAIDAGSLEQAAALESEFAHVKDKKNKFGTLMSDIALSMLGTPYQTKLLDLQLPEYLFISTKRTDCMLFVENVWAIASMINDNEVTKDKYVELISEIRYHDSNVGYCTRNHYFTDWANDGIKTGIWTDFAKGKTKNVVASRFGVLSKYISQESNIHNTTAFKQCIAKREQYLNNIHIGMFTLSELKKHRHLLRNGDIIGISRNFPGNDVSHIGIVIIKNKKLGMIDASMSKGKVVYEEDLIEYLSTKHSLDGVVVLRPTGKN